MAKSMSDAKQTSSSTNYLSNGDIGWFQYKIIEILLCTLLLQADKIWVPKRDTQVQPSVLGLSPWQEFSYPNKSSIVPWFPSVQPPPA
jgi:hypothetical protein